MQTPNKPGSPAEAEVARQVGKMTRRGLAWGGAAIVSALAARRWIATRPDDRGVPWPLRRVLQLNEQAHRAVFGANAKLAPEFPASAARMPRVNGRNGIDPNLDPEIWRLRVSGPTGSNTYTLADVKA